MRHALRIAVTCLLVVVLLSGWSGLAAAAPTGDAKAAGHGAETKHEGGIFELRGDLGIWTLCVFLGLFFLLSKFAWKPILVGLNKREAGIKAAITESENLRTESAKLKEQLSQEMARASEKVREIMEEARRDAQHLTEDMISKARTEIQTERDRLYRELRLAQDSALKELWTKAANLAALLSTKAIRRELSPADHSRLLEEALSELGSQGKAYVESNFSVRA